MVFEMWDAAGNYAYSAPVTFDCADGEILTTVYEDQKTYGCNKLTLFLKLCSRWENRNTSLGLHAYGIYREKVVI